MHLKKLSAETTPQLRRRDLGSQWRKKICKRSVDSGKNFPPSRNHDTPGEKIIVRPLTEGTFNQGTCTQQNAPLQDS